MRRPIPDRNGDQTENQGNGIRCRVTGCRDDTNRMCGQTDDDQRGYQGNVEAQDDPRTPLLTHRLRG